MKLGVNWPGRHRGGVELSLCTLGLTERSWQGVLETWLLLTPHSVPVCFCSYPERCGRSGSMAGQTGFDAAFPGYFLCVFPLWLSLKSQRAVFSALLALPLCLSIYLSLLIPLFCCLFFPAVPSVIWMDIIALKYRTFFSIKEIREIF